MKTCSALIILVFSSILTVAQEIIDLPYESPKGIVWNGPEKEYFSEEWQTKVVTNVSKPTMQVYRPSDEKNTGTSVIVAPGGGLYALSIDSEGKWVADWLVEKGITVFVLRYRLVPTGEDGVAEMAREEQEDSKAFYQRVLDVIPSSTADGLAAISYVRKNATRYNISPDKIGFMGFSAGGAVTMGVAYDYTDENRPNFLVPIYAWTEVMPVRQPKKDSPPIMVICSTNDDFGLAPGSVDIYKSWYDEGISAELIMYSKGGHGYGMRKLGLPSDKWIERFYDWVIVEGLYQPN